jgi:hypothetical protein
MGVKPRKTFEEAAFLSKFFDMSIREYVSNIDESAFGIACSGLNVFQAEVEEILHSLFVALSLPCS